MNETKDTGKGAEVGEAKERNRARKRKEKEKETEKEKRKVKKMKKICEVFFHSNLVRII